MNALPKSCENFKDALQLGREQSIALKQVHLSLIQKRLQTEEMHGEGVTARGRPKKRNQKNNFKNKSWSKSKGKYKYFHCHKAGHFKRNCLDKKNKPRDQPKESGKALVASEGDDTAEGLAITNQDYGNEWILDSGCSFHMCST